MTNALCQLTPSKYATLESTAVVTTTCAPPSPKMGPRRFHSFFGLSSKPIRNSSSTTPNSAKCMMACTSRIKPSPHGPIAIPASK
ncbi:Uncharacterised protein [Vibrio cholerae]|nr:Uncharacterised protein [Vibrio cholerae]CSC04788.1 Uncharacterised protein [Vibrio cholerae]CSD13467.1 Uncharacterised protein [Vibrio cholerae]CSI75008.1 Uncharacterised protein [Vibrio cholerae]